jgi:hypothetical protein
MVGRFVAPFAILSLAVSMAASCGSSGVKKTDVSPANGDAAGEVPVRGDDFPEWWDPVCGTKERTCDLNLCRTSSLQVSPLPCGDIQMVVAGCIRKDSGTTGWGCWVRSATNQIIQSEDLPLTADGLQTCQAAGVTNDFGFYQPACPDGGAASPEDASTSPSCALASDGGCTATTPNTSCTPLTARPYDRVKACVSGASRTVACCATEAGAACTEDDSLGCVTSNGSNGTAIWWTSGLWSAPTFDACDDALREMVTAAPTCSP